MTKIPDELVELWNAIDNWKHQEVLANMLSGMTQAKAYMKVYECDPSSAYSCASIMLRDSKVVQFREAHKRWRHEQSVLTETELIDFCLRTIRCKPSDLIDDDGEIIEENADLISEVTCHYHPTVGTLTRKAIKVMSKSDAIKILVTIGVLDKGNDADGLARVLNKIKPSYGLPKQAESVS